jgi:hypothetical protein
MVYLFEEFCMSESKTKVLIYLRKEEKEMLEELAIEYGLSFSRYLVLTALGKLKTNKAGVQ